jgi:hypothetical protein
MKQHRTDGENQQWPAAHQNLKPGGLASRRALSSGNGVVKTTGEVIIDGVGRYRQHTHEASERPGAKQVEYDGQSQM